MPPKPSKPEEERFLDFSAVAPEDGTKKDTNVGEGDSRSGSSLKNSDVVLDLSGRPQTAHPSCRSDLLASKRLVS